MELTEQIEAYLRGEMTAEESAAFERMRASDPVLDQRVVAHESFIQQIKTYGERRKLVSEMNVIHEQLDVNALKAEVLPVSTMVRILWNKYRINAAVAASVAVLAVFATLFSTGFFAKTSAIASDNIALRREMSRVINTKVQRSQNEILKNIKATTKAPVDPAIFGGTGFALTADGYVVTNYHVVKDADSVYIQNTDGESYKASTIYSYPAYDIAILKITDAAFKTLKPLPYTFKKTTSDLGEDVFTYGFPKDELVFSKGYLSSRTGHSGDTTEYQVDISVNPGSSGGPLLDGKGNIIGVIKGKSSRTEGASFAIKSGYLLEAIASIPKDSLGEKLVLNKKNTLSNLSRKDQIKKIEDYIYMVKVY